ncbi:MAG: siphovirus ReqiPepy6 Gp37-like family protein [Clostridia bacterium]|nr:siphovirus ReqiPepy6 Gp37-like family protein [Clostridia bacterium]
MDVFFFKYDDVSKKLIPCAVVDDYTSFVYTRSYSGIGAWQMVLPLESNNASQILDADVIAFRLFVAGLITKITKSVTDGNETLTIKGVELKGLVKHRIVIPPDGTAYVTYKQKPHQIIHSLLHSQLTEADEQRIIPGTVGYVSSLDDTIRQVLTYKGRYSSLEEDVSALCEEYALGYYTYLDNKNEMFWTIFQGKDRTNKQSANPKMVFSYENDTLDSSSLESTRNNTNYLVVAGQGEGADRAIAIVGNSTGFRRVEGFVDARDISDDSLLPERGAAKLAEYGDSVLFTARASQNVTEKYESEFDLGDLCTVIDTYGGVSFEVDARITEITECYEDGALTLDLTFGYDKTGLSDVINRKMQNTQSLINKE